LTISTLRLILLVVALAAVMPASADQEAGLTCVPVSERGNREFGCFILAHQPLARLNSTAVFWHLDRYPSRALAEAVKGSTSVVLESLGSIWLLTIGDAQWRAAGGERVATVGPLQVRANVEHAAQYMEAVFKPGMKSSVHRHSGPEAWYTLSGETCLETPGGTMVGRAGGAHVIVPGGPPMELTATGTEVRRALVLILHDSSQPPTSRETTWIPKGLCK
jgi:quercetin dioxygenase-like cupin family protein